MYTISNETEKEVQSWVDKLPDSMVKSQIINLFADVYPTNRMTTEQLEKFLSFQNALPKEFQPYPQTFAQILKNPSPDTKNVLAESHAYIKADTKSGAKGDQKQEILHTLGVTDTKKSGTKSDPTHVNEDLVEKPKAEEKKDAKTGKPESQAKEEESIIARNRDVSDAPSKEKEKPQVVVIDKSKIKK